MHNRSSSLADKLYHRFYGFAPVRAQIIPWPRVMPPVVVDLGDLGGLIYRSEKWRPGEKQTYIHFMESPPWLVCNPQGTQLFIVGGNYRITANGIEG